MGVGLMAGGPVALVYGFMFVFSGTLACAASVAEMASICPISGAQYHWTYMFAPTGWKVFLSFMQGKKAVEATYDSIDWCTGWTTVFAWQATITSLTFLTAGQLQGIVVFSDLAYTPERWHTTLIMWLVVLVAWIQNVWGVRLLPTLELFAGGFHVLMFFVFSIVMLVMGRNASADFVFTGFINETGWDNSTVAWFIGLLPSIWCVIGKYCIPQSYGSLLSLIESQASMAQFTSAKRPRTPPIPSPKSSSTQFSSTALWHSCSC